MKILEKITGFVQSRQRESKKAFHQERKIELEHKRKKISEGFETVIRKLGRNPGDVNYIPCKKIDEVTGEIPIPGEVISVIGEKTTGAKADMSYIYEIEYRVPSDLLAVLKESQMVLLRENQIVWDTPCPDCNSKSLDTDTKLLIDRKPDMPLLVPGSGDYRKCVCYTCGHTAAFIFWFKVKR